MPAKQGGEVDQVQLGIPRAVRSRFALAPLASILALAARPAPAAAAFKLSYQYNLATPTGEVRTSGLGLSYDPSADELFTVGYGLVRIYNKSGMEVYSFGDDEELGRPLGAAALENGDILVLSLRDGKTSIVRCNFRGDREEAFELRGVPEEFASVFGAGAIAYAKGKIYLADLLSMRVLIIDTSGTYLASYDVAALLQVEEKRQDLGLNGFSVDKDGNFLFTISPLFKAYVVSLNGEVRSFGKPGSAPGRFNIAAGIASDEAGRIYVADMLKCAVIVFDKEFNFLGEFGYRGFTPGRLIAPRDIAVGNGVVYVAQNGQRGVSAYQILPNEGS